MRSKMSRIGALTVLVLLLATVAAAQTGQDTQNASNYETTYVYYVFSEDCGSDGCRYECDTPQCDNSSDGEAMVTSGDIDLEIESASYPRQINAGDEVTFRVAVKNQGDQDAENVRIGLQAYGQLKQAENIRIESGRQQTFDIVFTLPKDASGPEQVEVTATALGPQGEELERDITTFEISVSDLYMTLWATPSRVMVGDQVELHGQISATNTAADLYVGGQYISTVRSDETGHYSHTIVASEPGVFPVRLVSGNTREQTFIRVDPRLGVRDVQIPETANTQDRFEVCATVFKSTAGQVTVDLLVDGQQKKTDTVVVNGDREVCFTTRIQEMGTHTVTFRLTADGMTTSRSQEMQVVESRIEVNVFPEQITLQEGSSGVFQIEMRNDDIQQRTFRIHVDGLEQITETTDETVALRSGEERTVFIRATAEQKGVYTGNITVTSDNQTFAQREVTVFVSTNPELKGPFSRARERVGNTVQYVEDRAPQVIASLVVLLLIVAIAVALYRRARRQGAIEPRY